MLTKVYRGIYNSPITLIRRIKKNMGVFYLTVSMTMIPLGFVMLIYGLDKSDKFWLIAGGGVITIAVLMWYRATSMAKKKKKKKKKKKEENDRRDRIITLLEKISKNMDNDKTKPN